MRKLGIPCVLDRFVQQAVLQALQRQWVSLINTSRTRRISNLQTARSSLLR